MPEIINLDSEIDMLRSVESSYLDLDFEAIRQVLCPLVSLQDWTTRLNELGCIALIDRQSLEKAYSNARFYEESSEQRRPWPTQKISRNQRNEGEGRPPKRGEGLTIVDPLGIYVGSLKTWMDTNFIQDSSGILNSAFAQQPAILLCPEAMFDFAGRLYPACKTLRNPFGSLDEAFTFILNSVLLHEFGHHFFPTQKSGGGLYLNEALANLFAYHGLAHGMRGATRDAALDRLVYKTFLFQPAAYSAYRPLNATFEVDPHTKFAVGMCFTGNTWQWASLRGKPCQGFHIDIGASRQMGICLDYEASQGLWYDELRDLIGRDDTWLNSFWGGGLHFHSRFCSAVSGNISPDFLSDLYERRHLNNWMEVDQYALGVMSHWWNYGPVVSWPIDCLNWSDIKQLTTLSDPAAEVVRFTKTWLKLDHLDHLSDSAASSLGKSSRAPGIDIPKLKTLSSAAAAGLCGRHKFHLRLDGLTAIPDDTAKGLGKHRGELSLLSVSFLSDNAAECLAKVDGSLKLDGLTFLSDEAAEHLSNHRGDLSLDGLTSISDTAAKHLSKHKGQLSLRGLRNLTDAAAESFSQLEGRLRLNGLCQMSAIAKKHLS